MGSICLSTASILLCEPYSQLQDIVLVIPTAIEVIFSTLLIFTRGSRRNLWLTAEGWIYFALALVDMLSRIIPAARDSLPVLKIVLAATSLFPIFFYILFIFLFTWAELIDDIPHRLQATIKSMVVLIPLIVVFNELASFAGLTYHLKPPKSLSVPGFDNDGNKLLWTLFTSFTLALLTVYQVIIFLLAFYRLVRAILDQRRIKTTSTDDIHLLRGIGWITGALQIGAIETVVGFATGNFGVALTRRILRMLARALLCIGVGKGIDFVEDFEVVRQEILPPSKRQEFRRSRLREFISNPRSSTFQQLTPTATSFHAAPRAHGISPLAQNDNTRVGMKHFAEIKQSATLENSDLEKTPRQRVTVNFIDGTPRLNVRLSELGIPPPIFTIEHHPFSKLPPIFRPTSYYSDFLTTPQRQSLLSPLLITDSEAGYEVKLTSFDPPHSKKLSRGDSTRSTRSVAESYYSLSAVRELASQFPSLPTNVRPEPVEHHPAAVQEQDFWDDSASDYILSPGLEGFRAKVARSTDQNSNNVNTVIRASILLSQPLPTLQIPNARRYRSSNVDVPTSAIYITTPITARPDDPTQVRALLSTESTSKTTETDLDPDTFLDLGTALNSEKSRHSTKGPATGIDVDTSRPAARRTVLAPISERQSEASHRDDPDDLATHRESVGSDYGGSRKSDVDALVIPWLKNPEMMEGGQRSAGNHEESRSTRMNIRVAPIRSTPVPRRSGDDIIVGSLYIEPITIPPRQRNDSVEIIQESFDSVNSRSVLRDSEVLGIEEGRYYHDSKISRGHF